MTRWRPPALPPRASTIGPGCSPFFLRYYGSAYLSKELQAYLAERGMTHTRGAPYHPMTQGKLERWHRSIKNVVTLENYYFPDELRHAIENFVHYYSNERFHESLRNVTPADVYFGRQYDVLSERDRIKARTLRCRKRENLAAAA